MLANESHRAPFDDDHFPPMPLLPPPNLLAEYERLSPGMSERLLRLAREQSFAQARITEVIIKERRRMIWSLTLTTLTVAAIMFAVAIWLFRHDEDAGGLVFAIGSIVMCLTGILPSALFSLQPRYHGRSDESSR